MKKIITLCVLLSYAVSVHADEDTSLMARITQLNPDIEIQALDSQYESMSLRTFSKVVKKYRKDVDWVAPHAFDCDDYAIVLKAGVSLQSLYDEKNYACGLIVVRHLKTFGDIPVSVNNTLHMLNIICLDDAIYVLEPQTMKRIPFEKYPNKTSIVKLII